MKWDDVRMGRKLQDHVWWLMLCIGSVEKAESAAAAAAAGAHTSVDAIVLSQTVQSPRGTQHVKWRLLPLCWAKPHTLHTEYAPCMSH